MIFLLVKKLVSKCCPLLEINNTSKLGIALTGIMETLNHGFV